MIILTLRSDGDSWIYSIFVIIEFEEKRQILDYRTGKWAMGAMYSWLSHLIKLSDLEKSLRTIHRYFILHTAG